MAQTPPALPRLPRGLQATQQHPQHNAMQGYAHLRAATAAAACRGQTRKHARGLARPPGYTTLLLTVVRRRCRLLQSRGASRVQGWQRFRNDAWTSGLAWAVCTHSRTRFWRMRMARTQGNVQPRTTGASCSRGDRQGTGLECAWPHNGPWPQYLRQAPSSTPHHTWNRRLSATCRWDR